MSAALEFRSVDVLFARADGRDGRKSIEQALRALDAGDAPTKIAADRQVTLAVRDASLAVSPGEICVVMGLSGSGKSTLLRTANGLTPATRGQVLLTGAGGTLARRR